MNDAVNPADILNISADPGVINVAGITYFQVRRNSLASEHAGHDGRIVQTNTGLLLQDGVNITDITAFNTGSLIIIIGNGTDYEVINGRYDVQIAGSGFGKLRRFFYRQAVLCKIYILVWVKKRGIRICNRNCNIFIQTGRVGGSRNVFVDSYGISTAPRGERKDFVTAAFKIIFISSIAAVEVYLQFYLGAASGISCGFLWRLRRAKRRRECPG